MSKKEKKKREPLLKGKLQKPEPSAIIALAALSLCALLPLRVYHVAALIDPETGFFSETGFATTGFFVVFIAVIVAVMALSFLNSKASRARDLQVKSSPLGIISCLCGLGIIYEAFLQMIKFIEAYNAYNPLIDRMTLSQSLSKSGATVYLFEAIFGVFAAFFFWVYAASCFNKKVSLRGYRILSVAPVLWAICRIIVRFVRKISFVNVSDLLMELFMLVFLITFMLAFSQVVTRVTPEIAAWRLYGCGLPAALLCFLTSVPRLFMVLVGHADSLVADYGFYPCDLALAIFIPVFLYNTATAKVLPAENGNFEQAETD